METSAVDEGAVVDETSVLQFEDGLPGFPAAKRFVLREIVEDGAFQLLTSLDVEGLELVVAQPWLFFPDYKPELGPQDGQDLELEEPEDALVFCAVTLPDGEGEPWTMNLLGPFVVNRHTLQGRQVVLEDEAANPVRAPLELP